LSSDYSSSKPDSHIEYRNRIPH